MDLEPASESLRKMEVILEFDLKVEPEMANTAPVSDNQARVALTADENMAIDAGRSSSPIVFPFRGGQCGISGPRAASAISHGASG